MKAQSILLIAVFCVSCAHKTEVKEPVEVPQTLSDSLPIAYPLDLWDNHVEGLAVLAVRISELGAVDSVVVAQSSGYAEFDSAAVQGVRQMKFTPGKQGERRVAMWTKLPVRFARDTIKKMGLGKE